jgi:uncharacterized protein (DUF58 family)
VNGAPNPPGGAGEPGPVDGGAWPARRVNLSWGPRAAGAAVAGLLLFGVFGARAPGSGGRLLAAGALVALVADFVLLRRALGRIHLSAAAPADATADRPFGAQVSLVGPRRTVRLGLAHDPDGNRFRVTPPVQAATLQLVAPARGSYDELSFVIDVDGLLGAGHLSVGVPLPRPLDVAPQPVPGEPVEPVLAALHAARDGTRPARGVVDGDSVRSVREYVPGDSPRVVHWALSARHGRLVVRELEPVEEPEQVVVVVDLGPEPGEAAEAVAARAAHLALTLLGRGFRLVLATSEPAGPRCAPVPDGLELGRRLARAVPGDPAGTVPPGQPALLISPTGVAVLGAAAGPGTAP